MFHSPETRVFATHKTQGRRMSERVAGGRMLFPDFFHRASSQMIDRLSIISMLSIDMSTKTDLTYSFGKTG